MEFGHGNGIDIEKYDFFEAYIILVISKTYTSASLISRTTRIFYDRKDFLDFILL